jgi:hypothetical protein
MYISIGYYNLVGGFMKRQRNYNPVSLNNLVTFADMDEQRHKELSSLGGIASGLSRRERSEHKAEIEAYMTTMFLAEECLGTLKEYRRWLKRKRSMEKKRLKRQCTEVQQREFARF